MSSERTGSDISEVDAPADAQTEDVPPQKAPEEKEIDYDPENDFLVVFPPKSHIVSDYELGCLMSGAWELRRVVITDWVIIISHRSTST